MTINYPKSIEAEKQLSGKISAVYAQAVISYLQKLNCTKENKDALLKALFESKNKRI